VVKYAQEHEPGTTNYAFLQDKDDPLTLMAVESFADQAALDTHCSSGVFETFLGVFGPMVEAKQVTVAQKTSNTDMLSGFGPKT